MKFSIISMINNLGEKRSELMGVAMLLILLYHYALRFGIYHSPIIVRGDIGVDMFLFLSGYGCCYSLKKNRYDEFYKHRIIRIIPIYIIVEIVVVLCNYIILYRAAGMVDMYRLLCVSYFFNGDLSVWYIHASLLLYSVTPLLVKMFRRYNFFFCYVIFLCTVLLVFLCAYHNVSYLNLLMYRIPIYTAGVYCALMSLGQVRTSSGILIGGGISYIAIMVALQYVLNINGVMINNQIRYIVYPIIAVVLIFICVLILPNSRLLSVLGLCSLECYLVHQPIMEYLLFIKEKALYLCVSIGTIIICVWLFHVINRWIKRMAVSLGVV